MSRVQTDLKKVKDLLIMPKDWTQGTMRRDREGKWVDARGDVRCRCLMAAMYDAVGGRATLDNMERVDAMEAALSPHFPQCSIAKFNDDPNTTHADILRVIDEAMK